MLLITSTISEKLRRVKVHSHGGQRKLMEGNLSSCTHRPECANDENDVLCVNRRSLSAEMTNHILQIHCAMQWYTNINCLWVWRVKCIHSVKDCIALFHKSVGEWNWKFIVQRVDKFQPSHKFKTVNICFILLLHKLKKT